MDRNLPVKPQIVAVPPAFGVLRDPTNEQSLDYELYEIASQNLGILSSHSLSPGDRLELELESTRIPVIVHQIAGLHDRELGLHRYRLFTPEAHVNFESYFPEQRLRSYSGHPKTTVRYARFPSSVLAPLILANTFGAGQTYKLKALNASRSGMLLEACPGSDAPFREGTLLEIKIQRSPIETIACLAKVVRCEYNHENSNRRYGVTLTDIPNEQREQFQSFIEYLETEANKRLLRATA